MAEVAHESTARWIGGVARSPWPTPGFAQRQAAAHGILRATPHLPSPIRLRFLVVRSRAPDTQACAGRFLRSLSAATELPRQVGDAGDELIEVWRLAVRRDAIDHVRQELCQSGAGFGFADACLAGNLRQSVFAEHLADRLRRQRQVSACLLYTSRCV